MGNLLAKFWFGDRMITAVGLLVAAAMASLFGVSFLVADRVDRENADNQVEVVRATVDALRLRIKNDLATFTPPDAAYELPAPTNARWIHRHYGQRLHAAGHYERIFVIGDDDRAIYAATDGALVNGANHAVLEPKIEQLAKDVREHYRNADAVSKLIASGAGDATPTPGPIYRSIFTRIDGKPALVAAMVSPPIFASSARAYSPPVMVAVAALNEKLLASLGAQIAIHNLRIVADETQATRGASLRLPFEAGERTMWLHWEPKKPGFAILLRIFPALAIIALLFGLIAAAVMRKIRQTTQELAISESRAREMAYRDPLTGLSNRLRLLEALNEQLPGLVPGQRLALFFLDLDGFKDINDTLGHPVGDELLAIVGERLEGLLGTRGVTARFGGDEFALLAPLGETGEIARIAERISDTVRQPIMAGEHTLHVGVTVGIAIAPEHGTEPEELLRRADIALYKAKSDCRGTHRIFDLGDETVLQNRRAIERDIERALWHDEFFPLFQPLFSADGERVEGVETLVRWQHPERGLVPPADFVHVAEKCGLIVRLDEWVLRKACEYGRHWPDISVAVNMSPSNFRQSNLAERVKRVIDETGFDPRRLEIEITEGMLLNANEDVLFDLAELREFGVRFAIDDFGTGYSSLGYLGSFPVDKIKIDKSFVQNLGVKEDAAAIVECVARLGRALGLAVTAEGVETAAQHRFVRAAGCQQMQGYLFSKPVRPAEITTLLKTAGEERRIASLSA